jgi:hypothetical protein
MQDLSCLANVPHSTVAGLRVQEAYRPDSPAGGSGGASLPEPGGQAPPRLPSAGPEARDSLAVLLEVRAAGVRWLGPWVAVGAGAK